MSVAVMGAGSWGSTLARIIGEKYALAKTSAEKEHLIYFWDRNPERIRRMTQTREYRIAGGIWESFSFPKNVRPVYSLHFLEDVECLIIAVPSSGFRAICELLKEEGLPKEIMVIGTCKGIECETLLFASQIVDEVLGPVPYGHLGGPGFAERLSMKEDTRLAIASHHPEVRDAVSEILNTSYLHIQQTDDLMGLQVAGATRTPASVALGAANELGFGARKSGLPNYINTRAAMFGRILSANAQLGVALGGRLETFLDVAGAGDLELCLAISSRNYVLGQRIVLEVPDYLSPERRVQEIQRIAKEIGTVEGYQTCKAVYDLAQQLGVEMPWVQEVYNVCHLGKPVDKVLETIRQRNVRRA